MGAFTVLTLYPLWSVSVMVGVTTLRLGRRASTGLVSLTFALALWVTGLVLAQHGAARPIADRLLPAGILMAAGIVHAGLELHDQAEGERGPPERRTRILIAVYGACILVALLGAIAPNMFYAPGLTAPGPLFYPFAALAGLATCSVLVWLARAARSSHGLARKRATALALGSVLASIGGGGAVVMQVALGVDLRLAAPTLLGALLLISYALLRGEVGRPALLVRQGLVHGVMTALLSAVGLTVFFSLVPALTPGAGQSIGWLVLVTFLAALPLDPIRALIVDALGRRLFSEPFGVRDLSDRVESTEVRADQAERLAEIGAMASAVAHEIRNPLGIIAAQAKLLERADAPAASVASLREQVRRSRRFLDDLLAYSKPRPLEVTDFDVETALRRAVERTLQSVGDCGSNIDVAVSSEDSLKLEADRNAFEDVLAILVHNAVAANASREDARIQVHARRVGEHVEVSVEDDGPGVAEPIADRLFTPFVSGRGRDSAFPGTGLGLAIASKWVERHGGSLTHERPSAGGARFLSRWPRGRGMV